MLLGFSFECFGILGFSFEGFVGFSFEGLGLRVKVV